MAVLGRKADGSPLELEPSAICTMGQAILATRGAGKSWLAAVEAEQLMEAGYPIAVLDAVGEHWSLKAKFPVVVFGGKHADVPLDAGVGREVANMILERKLRAVVDMTALRRADQPFFVADFCEELYEHGLKVKVPCWLLIEEAQNFVPQAGNPPCKRPILDLAEMGRHAGIGYCLVSHRSATIDKTALGLCDIIFFKRLTLPHDLEVVRGFFKARDPEHVDVAKALPGLANDEALIYFPLKLPKPIRFKVAKRSTPHMAETPTLELKLVAPPELKAVSEELVEHFKALIKEKAIKRDELEELRSRVEELQQELEIRDRRIEQLEHDLELAQRFKIELPPELLRIPGFTEKVEYLERELMQLYRTEAARSSALEEEVKNLKAQLETAGKFNFKALADQLGSTREALERSHKSLSSLLKSYVDAITNLNSTCERLHELAGGFISKLELKAIEERHKTELEELKRAESLRLNPSVIITMSRVVNELSSLTETGKQVLKAAATLDPNLLFTEEKIAATIGRSASTARQYLKQLADMGWLRHVGKSFQNNIGENLARRLKEARKLGEEPIPDAVIERCKNELQTFIQSL